MEQHLTLEEVSQAFTDWRRTRNKRTKIPDYLIQQITHLKKYPRFKIMQALKLNHRTLKEILDTPKSIDFISLPIIPDLKVTATVACTLSRADGAVLKIELAQTQLQDFVRTFLCCK
jgi:hypothetical protein